MRGRTGTRCGSAQGGLEDRMNAQRRPLVLLATLAAMAVTPALGQSAAPAPSLPSSASGDGKGGGNSGNQGAASIPDLSGVWAHPSWPSFEPPLTGPGPVRNRSRLRTGESNGNQLVGDYTNSALKP